MHTKKMGKTLPKSEDDQTISSRVSEALRQSHNGMTSAIHHISHVTQINEQSIRKWYEGKNTPSAAHLLTLMRYYPAVLQAILELIDRDDLWRQTVYAGIEKQMLHTLHSISSDYEIWEDIHVPPETLKWQDKPIDFNDRQVWFLDNLRRKGQMRVGDIADFWGVHHRTARRDIKHLREVGLISLVRSGRDSWYEMKGAVV